MPDRHAVQLPMTVHLQQLVPEFGTVFLKMLRLPRLVENWKHIYFDSFFPENYSATVPHLS